MKKKLIINSVPPLHKVTGGSWAAAQVTPLQYKHVSHHTKFWDSTALGYSLNRRGGLTYQVSNKKYPLIAYYLYSKFNIYFFIITRIVVYSTFG